MSYDGTGEGAVYDIRLGLRSTLVQHIISTVVLLMAGSAYFIGFGQMRYSAVAPHEPVQFFPFWQFFITGFLPFVVYAFVVYLLFTTAIRRRRGSRILPYIVMLMCAIAVAWSIVFVIWQATVWANCNDGGNILPAHPECINRKYPQEQSADWTFIIQVIGGGILAIPSLFGFWITQQVVNTELAAYSIGVDGGYIGDDISDADDENDIECHHDKKGRKQMHHRRQKKQKKTVTRTATKQQQQTPTRSDIGAQVSDSE